MSSLFGLGHEPASTVAPTAGLLVTNHLNLFYMLAAGLALPPAGFGDKYYKDTLESFPGWIPLFIDHPNNEAIASATIEAKHLKPVIVQFDLSRLSGQVIAMSAYGMERLEFPNDFSSRTRLILVPAPLPVCWIDLIAFRSASDRQACRQDAKDFGNVPLEDFKLLANSRTWFTKEASEPWPIMTDPVEPRNAPLQKPFAAGGVMAMLLRFANLGQQAVRACQDAFDPGRNALKSADEHPILAGIGSWVAGSEDSAPALPMTEAPTANSTDLTQAKVF